MKFAMRVQEAKDKLRVVYGITLKRVDGEFRVNFKGGAEATAYYTPWLDDAFATGVEMAQRRKEQ